MMTLVFVPTTRMLDAYSVSKTKQRKLIVQHARHNSKHPKCQPELIVQVQPQIGRRSILSPILGNSRFYRRDARFSTVAQSANESKYHDGYRPGSPRSESRLFQAANRRPQDRLVRGIEHSSLPSRIVPLDF
uniref:Uncharacterized protein n=1 Tax=Vespula pensylvanica TaxID=30213 RepID=A0A834PFE1_VESPE|nr:hypothetical protein H0235_001074 [Vespula pensylvanica]